MGIANKVSSILKCLILKNQIIAGLLWLFICFCFMDKKYVSKEVETFTFDYYVFIPWLAADFILPGRYIVNVVTLWQYPSNQIWLYKDVTKPIVTEDNVSSNNTAVTLDGEVLLSF